MGTPPDASDRSDTSGAHERPTVPQEGIDLRGQDLRKRDLTEVELRGADLRDCDVRNKDLHARHLQNAKLHGADLRGTNLVGADFTDCTGLTPGQLAAANLQGAILPEGLDGSDSLKAAEDAGASCRAVFMALLGACMFSLLTVSITTDANLRLDTSSSKLPFIDMDVPVGTVYRVAPWLLLGAFVYFQLYLQRLWDRVASLPAVRPDGRRLDEVLHPWLLASLVRVGYRHLRKTAPPWSFLQTVAALMLGWCLVPLVLGAMWLRTLPIGDVRLSLFEGIAALACVVVAYMTVTQGMATLSHRRFRPALHLAVSALVVLGLQAFGEQAAVPYWGTSTVGEYGVDLRGRDLTGSQLELKGAGLPSVNLSSATAWGADLRSANLMKGNLAYGRFEGANLTGASLIGAELKRAVFDDAILNGLDLRDAVATATELNRVRMQGAHAAQADLRLAKLNDAQLDGTNLWATRLNGAFLIGAAGKNIVFDAADLTDASAIQADFRHASFVGSVIERTDFSAATLIDANFDRSRGMGTQLTNAVLIGATFEDAALEQADFEGADLSYAAMQRTVLDGANLRVANLTGARMSASSLRNADLAGAILDSAVLEGCDLTGADLADVRGATRAQIERACADPPGELKLPDDVSVITLEPCPPSTHPKSSLAAKGEEP